MFKELSKIPDGNKRPDFSSRNLKSLQFYQEVHQKSKKGFADFFGVRDDHILSPNQQHQIFSSTALRFCPRGRLFAYTVANEP